VTISISRDIVINSRVNCTE